LFCFFGLLQFFFSFLSSACLRGMPHKRKERKKTKFKALRLCMNKVLAQFCFSIEPVESHVLAARLQQSYVRLNNKKLASLNVDAVNERIIHLDA